MILDLKLECAWIDFVLIGVFAFDCALSDLVVTALGAALARVVFVDTILFVLLDGFILLSLILVELVGFIAIVWLSSVACDVAKG